MTWWGWVLLAAYLVGALIAWPKVAYVMAHDVGSIYGPDGVDIFMGFLFGSLAAAVWPATWALYSLVQGKRESLLVAPRPIRRRVEHEQMQQRIAQLERELNIR